MMRSTRATPKSTSVIVGPFKFVTSTQQAVSCVDPDRDWKWVEDGPALKAAVEAAYDELKVQATVTMLALGVEWKLGTTVRPEAVKQIIADVVKAWDDAFGWDVPRMTEQTEDVFYTFLAHETVNRALKEG